MVKIQSIYMHRTALNKENIVMMGIYECASKCLHYPLSAYLYLLHVYCLVIKLLPITPSYISGTSHNQPNKLQIIQGHYLHKQLFSILAIIQSFSFDKIVVALIQYIALLLL